jgi:hypothetical protein
MMDEWLMVNEGWAMDGLFINNDERITYLYIRSLMVRYDR